MLIDAGTYAGFNTVRNGTLANPITIKADSGTVIVSSRCAQTIDNINVEGHDYIVIQGIRSVNSLRHGFRLVQSRGSVIRSCQSYDAAHTGMLLGQCYEVTIENSVAARAQTEHGIYFGESGGTDENHIIKNNEVFGNRGNGIQINGNGPGDATIKGVLIEGNYVHDNRIKGLSLIGMINSTVRFNTVVGNGTGGTGAAEVHLAKDPASGPSSHSNVINGNLINGPRLVCIRFTEDSINNQVYDNTLIQPSSGWIINNSSGSQIIGTNDLRTS